MQQHRLLAIATAAHGSGCCTAAPRVSLIFCEVAPSVRVVAPGFSLMKIWYICSVKKTDETSLQVAKLLLEIKAVKLSPDQPFRWASGWNSPIYCDNRITLSYPKARTYIRQQLANLISGRLGEVDESAAMVCFMASEECSFTTASTFDTSGGRTTY